VSRSRVLLIYPVREDFEPNRGVLNKMRYQTDALRSLGFEVTTVVGREQGVVFNGTRVVEYRRTGGRPRRVVNHYAWFWGVVARQCAAEDYDAVYIRHPGSNPAFLGFLARMRRGNAKLRIILEVATYPMAGEADSLAQKLILASDTICSPLLRRFVNYVVTFSSHSEIYGIPCIRSSNGIDVSAVRLRGASKPDRSAPRLLGVASLAKWHGYDRVLHGLRRALDQNPSVTPHVSFAGHGPAAAELRELCTSLGLDDHVTFHGMTTGTELDELFDRSDVAIASLGMHRIGVERASSLKTREYCARGVPFVLAGRDDSFPETFPFALRVPVGDEPIDLIKLLDDFGAAVSHVEDPAAEMRSYAVDHLSWTMRVSEIMRVALG
jgi:glycosyltransferase involved in cell wall biosynthesis